MPPPGLLTVCTEPLYVSTHPLALLAVQCWLLCSPAPSKKNPKCRGVSVHERLQRKQRPSASLCRFSSLLVGIRANFTHIKVEGDKTGCHRFACNVSWAWFLLWTGSAALHVYSDPPKTIPCVICLRNLSDAENLQAGGAEVCEPGPSSGLFPAVHQDTTSFTLQQQGLVERTGEDISAPPSSAGA